MKPYPETKPIRNPDGHAHELDSSMYSYCKYSSTAFEEQVSVQHKRPLLCTIKLRSTGYVQPVVL